MHNAIILSSCLFGSVYLCSESLKLINNLFLENKKIPYKLIVINGLTFLSSASIFFYTFNFLTNYKK